MRYISSQSHVIKAKEYPRAVHLSILHPEDQMHVLMYVSKRSPI